MTGSGFADIFGTLLVDALTFDGNYSFPDGMMEPGSTVNYCALGNQTIKGDILYVNLVTSGSGTKTLDGDTFVTNGTVGAGTIFNPNGHLITGSGNADILGTLLVDAATMDDNYAFSYGTMELIR